MKKNKTYITYPWVIASFSLFVMGGVLYNFFTVNSLDLVGKIISFFLPLLFLALLEHKKLDICPTRQNLIVSTKTLLKSSSHAISFADIKSLDISTGKGSSSHMGVLRLLTKDEKHFILTSMGACTRKKLRKIKEEIEDLISEN